MRRIHYQHNGFTTDSQDLSRIHHEWTSQTHLPPTPKGEEEVRFVVMANYLRTPREQEDDELDRKGEGANGTK
jgi:hypothetical protein